MGTGPSADALFRSAALAYGSRVIALVLSVTLDDCAAGARAVASRGGIVAVQDPTQATYPGMPNSVISATGTDLILPVDQLADLIVRLAGEELDEAVDDRPEADLVVENELTLLDEDLDDQRRGLSAEDARGRLLGHSSSRCVLFRVDPEILAARRLDKACPSDSSEPYLREVEGEIYGPEYWDATPGLAVMRDVVQGTFRPPCFRLMGLRGLEVTEGEMTLAMPASGWLANSFGVLYGGAIAFLADAAIILSAGSTVPAGTAFNTIDLKLYFLRPVVPGDGDMVARAKIVHGGRTIAVANCEITGPDGALAGDQLGPDSAGQALGTSGSGRRRDHR